MQTYRCAYSNPGQPSGSAAVFAGGVRCLGSPAPMPPDIGDQLPGGCRGSGTMHQVLKRAGPGPNLWVKVAKSGLCWRPHITLFEAPRRPSRLRVSCAPITLLACINVTHGQPQMLLLLCRIGSAPRGPSRLRAVTPHAQPNGSNDVHLPPQEAGAEAGPGPSFLPSNRQKSFEFGAHEDGDGSGNAAAGGCCSSLSTCGCHDSGATAASLSRRQQSCRDTGTHA